MRNSQSSLFLMELMISILFFSLSSAVCIQLFVKAYTLNQTTEEQSHATQIAQDISEYFHHSEGDIKQLLSYFSEYERSGNTVLLFFSDSGTSCDAAHAKYIADLNFSTDGSYSYLDIHIHTSHTEDVIYASTLKKYRQAVL